MDTLHSVAPIISVYLGQLVPISKRWVSIVTSYNACILERLRSKYTGITVQESLEKAISQRDRSTLYTLRYEYIGYLPINWERLSFMCDRTMIDLIPCSSPRHIKYIPLEDFKRNQSLFISSLIEAIVHKRYDIADYLYTELSKYFSISDMSAYSEIAIYLSERGVIALSPVQKAIIYDDPSITEVSIMYLNDVLRHDSLNLFKAMNLSVRDIRFKRIGPRILEYLLYSDTLETLRYLSIFLIECCNTILRHFTPSTHEIRILLVMASLRNGCVDILDMYRDIVPSAVKFMTPKVSNKYTVEYLRHIKCPY